MRARKAIINTAVGIVNTVITIICGFFIAQTTLRIFGSAYNGLTSSITQYLGIISLLQMGLFGVVQASLYKPLAENNLAEVSVIIRTTESFLRKISLIFIGLMLVVACFYPFLVGDEFDWLFVFTFTLVIGVSTFIQYYFGLAYNFLLGADQRLAFTAAVSIVVQMASAVSFVLFANFIDDLRIIRLFVGIIGIAGTFFIFYSARKRYKIDRSVRPDKSALKNRWDAFGQHIAAFVNGNTDIIILSIFANLREISVYAVYFMIAVGIYSLFNPIVSSVTAAFGNMFAKDEYEQAEEGLRLIEQIVFSVATFLFGVTMVMIVPFVDIYTKGLSDANYHRPLFALLISLAMFMQCLRSPYVAVVYSLGRFRQTRNAAFVESGIKILLTLSLTWKYGLIGVAVGTLAAYTYRAIIYAWYISRHIIIRRIHIFVKRLTLSLLCLTALLTISFFVPIDATLGYGLWAIKAAVTGTIAGVFILSTEFIFYRSDLFRLLGLLAGSTIKNNRA